MIQEDMNAFHAQSSFQSIPWFLRRQLLSYSTFKTRNRLVIGPSSRAVNIASMASMASMSAANRLKVAFDEGRQAFGCWQMIPGSNVSRTLARTGVDWVLVDCEHGNIDGIQRSSTFPQTPTSLLSISTWERTLACLAALQKDTPRSPSTG